MAEKIKELYIRKNHKQGFHALLTGKIIFEVQFLVGSFSGNSRPVCI